MRFMKGEKEQGTAKQLDESSYMIIQYQQTIFDLTSFSLKIRLAQQVSVCAIPTRGQLSRKKHENSRLAS